MNELLETPYLKRQIIPYIGNKRRLLPLILNALEKIGFIGRDGSKFLDLFSGSGVVSRLARVLDFDVYSNDWEYYSYIINTAYLAINNSDLKNLYKKWGGIDGILEHLNQLPDPKDEDLFIAKYYSPSDDLSADYRKERLFYTRYNGLIIDKIRDEIERLYPDEQISGDKTLRMEKYILLSQLLYQAATHTNTSGVFKAYHKGFGGFSGDALSRILKRIVVERPVLIDSEYKGHVFMEDANKLIKNSKFNSINFDIVYIDPPYNQHQYGSNYHLLNTIAKWDKRSLIMQLENNLSKKKAGIREDWIRTRSLYCYRETASKVLEDLLQSVNGRYLLISYNTEGIIPIEQLVSIASNFGKVEIIGNEYIKYRGGRQSIARVNNNFEFLLIVNKDEKSRSRDIFAVDINLLKRRLQLQFKKSYSLERLKRYFNILKNGRLEFAYGDHKIILRTMNYFYLLEEELDDLFNNIKITRKNYNFFNNLLKALKESQCKNVPEEIDEIIRIVNNGNLNEKKILVKKLPNLLKKIAHKKYKDTFYRYAGKIKNLNKLLPDSLKIEIQNIENLAERRFNG